MKSASNRFFATFTAAALFACTNAPPEGAHATANADAAVVDSTRCASCHMPEFQATNSPPHPGARPTACGVCHTQNSWHAWRVDHPGWELTGAHARAAADRNVAGTEQTVKCFWCHRGDVSTFKNTKKDCFSCHAEDRETQDEHSPSHAAFEKTCETCHGTDAWKPAKRPAPVPEPPPMPPLIAPEDAGAHAAPRAPPTPTKIAPPKAVPSTPTPTPPKPDVISRPSRRAH